MCSHIYNTHMIGTPTATTKKKIEHTDLDVRTSDIPLNDLKKEADEIRRKENARNLETKKEIFCHVKDKKVVDCSFAADDNFSSL
jgi:hypothetical protein